VIRLPPYHPDLNRIKNVGCREDQNSCKYVTFKLRDVKQLAEQNVAAVTVEGWAAVGRHVEAVEEEYMSRDHEMDSVMERIITNADDDNTSESSVSCDDNADIKGVGPLFSDSK